MAVASDEPDDRLRSIGHLPFRTCFHLKSRDRALADLRGIEAVRRHTREI